VLTPLPWNSLHILQHFANLQNLWHNLPWAGNKFYASNTLHAFKNQITEHTSLVAFCHIHVAIFSWPVHTVSNRWWVIQHAVLPAMISKSLLHTHSKWMSFSCKMICHVNLLSDSPSCSAHGSCSTTVF
jgi:hypothetical protein